MTSNQNEIQTSQIQPLPSTISMISFYSGEISGVTVRSTSVSKRCNNNSVMYCTNANVFVTKNSNYYYNKWQNSRAWNNSNNHPYQDVLYIDSTTGNMYIFEEVIVQGQTQYNRIQVDGGQLAGLRNLTVDGGYCTISTNIIIMGDIVLGRNLQLSFTGGTISGTPSAYYPTDTRSTIEGNNSAIVAPIVQLFMGNMPLLTGTWNVTESYPEWWGAQGDDLTDDLIPLQEAITSPIPKVRLLNKKYCISNTLVIRNRIFIEGIRRHNDYDGLPAIGIVRNSTYSENSPLPVLIKIASPFVTLKDFSIQGRQIVQDGIGVEKSRASDNELYYPYRLNLEGLSVNNCRVGYHVFTFLSLFTNCTATNTEYGFFVGYGTSTTMTNCYVNSFVNSAYYIEHLTYSTMINCCADRHIAPNPDGEEGNSHARSIFGHTYYLHDCKALTIQNCAAEFVSKGFALDNCDTISISNSRMDMQRIGECKKTDGTYTYMGCWLYCTFVHRLTIDGMYLSNYPIETVGQCPDWDSITNLVYSYSNLEKCSVLLRNVYMTGSDNSGQDTPRYLRSSMITTESKAIVQVEYDHWKKSGSLNDRPIGSTESSPLRYDFDNKIGVGFLFLLTTPTPVMQVWTGSIWKNL